MNTNDDPRLTAYALGEMNDAERAAFEAELAADPATKVAADGEIASLRAFATALTGELGAERDAMKNIAMSAPGIVRRPRHIVRWALAAAAAVVVGGLAFSILTPSLNRARETANPKSLAQVMEREAQAQMQTGQKRQSENALAFGMKTESAGLTLNKPADPSLAAGLLTKSQLADIQNHYQFSAGQFADGKGKDAAYPGQRPAVAAGANVDGRVVVGDRVWEKRLPEIVASDVTANEKFGQTARGRIDDKERYDIEVTSTASTESYAKIYDNNFLDPHASPLSTFGIDVDTASYANVRRFLDAGQRPPADSVRIEEMINYFPTSDPPPTDGRPFAVKMEVAACPWMPQHRLVRVALKAKVIDRESRPATNLVFLIDVSGSMNEPNKLPLVKRSLRKLVGQLGENDRVAIVVYAGSSGLALPSTNASDKATILKAIDNLEAGGSTNGGQGIQLAYATALEHFSKDNSSRVILCTDGDFNVGVTDRGELFSLIVEKAKAGVFLNVLGFGSGNLKDDTMEGLADKGNGQYAYVDSDREADKVLVEQVGGTLQTIAKDVKLQLEFNPATVKSYRLIGYENRVMAAQDFNNDLKDSGDMGAGHSVVALYEIDLARSGVASDPVKAEPALKYQPQPREARRLVASDTNERELLTLKLRYKRPDAPLEQGTSELIETTLEDRADASIGAASTDMRFAAAVAGFGMLLRESPHRSACTWELVRSLAHDGLGDDAGGHRSEFLNLIDAAKRVRP